MQRSAGFESRSERSRSAFGAASIGTDTHTFGNMILLGRRALSQDEVQHFGKVSWQAWHFCKAK